MTDRPAVHEPSDAILTAPNVISLVRLLLIPPFLYLALALHQDAAAWLTGFVLGSTDWVDGWVARRYHQVSKLGIAMDPLIDRLAVVALASVMVLRDLAPLWAIVVIFARELLLLAAVPVVAALGVERPAVTRTGKIGFFLLMWSFAAFFAVEVPHPPAPLFLPVAWLLYVGGVSLGYAAAFGYLQTALRSRWKKNA